MINEWIVEKYHLIKTLLNSIYTEIELKDKTLWIAKIHKN